MSFVIVIVEPERTDGVPTRLLNKLNTKADVEGISHLSPGVWLIDTSKAIRFLAEIIDDVRPPVKCRVLLLDKEPVEASLAAL